MPTLTWPGQFARSTQRVLSSLSGASDDGRAAVIVSSGTSATSDQ
jgi:hypothetical protein